MSVFLETEPDIKIPWVKVCHVQHETKESVLKINCGTMWSSINSI